MFREQKVRKWQNTNFKTEENRTALFETNEDILWEIEGILVDRGAVNTAVRIRSRLGQPCWVINTLRPLLIKGYFQSLIIIPGNFYSKLRTSLQVTSQSVQTWNALHCCLHHIKDWNHQLMLALFFSLYAIMISIYLLFMTDLQEHVSDTDSPWPWTLSLTFKVTNIHVPLDFVSFVLSLLIINGFLPGWNNNDWYWVPHADMTYHAFWHIIIPMCQNIYEFLIIKIICSTHEALPIINLSDARYYIKKNHLELLGIKFVYDLDLY